MRSHKLLSHVADVRLQVEGDVLEELFRAALEGMANLTKEGVSKEECNVEIKIELSATDVTALLIDFLSEVLTQQHVNKSVYFKVEFEKFSKTLLKAKVFGVKTDSFDEDIKAVTYHEAEVVKDNGKYKCVIVFDI